MGVLYSTEQSFDTGQQGKSGQIRSHETFRQLLRNPFSNPGMGLQSLRLSYVVAVCQKKGSAAYFCGAPFLTYLALNFLVDNDVAAAQGLL